MVLKKLKRSQPALIEILDKKVLLSTVDKLFPYVENTTDGQEIIPDTWDEKYSITEAEIFNILKKRANANKVPEIDGIKSIFLKRIPEAMLKRLTYIYNIYIKAGVFSNIWKRAILILIPKGELDIKVPKNRCLTELSNFQQMTAVL